MTKKSRQASPSQAARDFAAELQTLAGLLRRHSDPAIAESAAPSVESAARVILALAAHLSWLAECGDELAVLLCRDHAWAQAELRIYGPGTDGVYHRRLEDAARALDLGFKVLTQLQRAQAEAFES